MTTTFSRPILVGLVALAILAAVVIASTALGLTNATPLGGSTVYGPPAAPALDDAAGNANAVPAAAPAAQPAAPAPFPVTFRPHRIIVPAGGAAANSGSRDTACPNNQPCDDK